MQENWNVLLCGRNVMREQCNELWCRRNETYSHVGEHFIAPVSLSRQGYWDNEMYSCVGEMKCTLMWEKRNVGLIRYSTLMWEKWNLWVIKCTLMWAGEKKGISRSTACSSAVRTGQCTPKGAGKEFVLPKTIHVKVEVTKSSHRWILKVVFLVCKYH